MEGSNLLSRLKTYKKQKQFKKVSILLGALLVSICIGSGMNIAMADQDIETMLINWFNSKKIESIKEIETAITSEKDQLKTTLTVELQNEMQLAENELASSTDAEKEQRISSLREYADSLLSSYKIDNSEEKEAMKENLDFIIKQAIAQMNGAAVPTSPLPLPNPVPAPELQPAPIPAPSPVVEPEDDSTTQPTPAPQNEGTPKEDENGKPESGGTEREAAIAELEIQYISQLREHANLISEPLNSLDNLLGSSKLDDSNWIGEIHSVISEISRLSDSPKGYDVPLKYVDTQKKYLNAMNLYAKAMELLMTALDNKNADEMKNVKSRLDVAFSKVSEIQLSLSGY